MKIEFKRGDEAGPYAGRTFVTVDGAYRLAQLELRRAGAIYRGTSYVLPLGISPRSLRRIEVAAECDAEAAMGKGVLEHRMRCEALEITISQARARSTTGSLRDQALAAARRRLASLSVDERRVLEDVIRAGNPADDEFQTLVLAGDVRLGDQIARGADLNRIDQIGPVFQVTDENQSSLMSRFPDAKEIRIGDHVQLVSWCSRNLVSG